MADPQATADQIREMGSEEFQDSNHAHEVLTNYSEIIRAVQEGLTNLADQVEDAPGITNDYAEAARETAGQMSGLADGLHEQIGEGIVRS
jgi:hypothetical protein